MNALAKALLGWAARTPFPKPPLPSPSASCWRWASEPPWLPAASIPSLPSSSAHSQNARSQVGDWAFLCFVSLDKIGERV